MWSSRLFWKLFLAYGVLYLALSVAFVVDTDGTVRSIAVKHRAYRTGPLNDCMQGALAGRLAPSGGADCPAEFPLDLRGL